MYAWYKTLNLAFFHLTTYLGDHIVSASSGCFNRMPQMGWFNTHLFHRVLEARDQGASAVRFLMRTLLLAGRWSPFLVSSYDRAEREKVSFVSSCKDMNFIIRAPPLRPNCLLMAPLLNTIISRIGCDIQILGGHIQSTACIPIHMQCVFFSTVAFV